MEGRVASIFNRKDGAPVGVFVQMEGFRQRMEGLVHVSQLVREGRVNNIADVMKVGQRVKVKVLKVTKSGEIRKTSLTIKDVDQVTGEDLNPESTARPTLSQSSDSAPVRNPDRPAALSEIDRPTDTDVAAKRSVQRLDSPQRWELKQMLSAGCYVDKRELPNFDEDTGVLPNAEDDDEDVEIEIVEEEPAFLRGYGRATLDMDPVKIVKNPDGSLAQAAMMQGALSKERRELKQAARLEDPSNKPAPVCGE